MRRLLLGISLVGCSSTSDPASGDPRLDLEHADPRVRIRAAEQVVRETRIDLCELLVKNLSDRDGAVRLFASIALRKLTSEDFGYKSHGTLPERREAIERWKRWLRGKGLMAQEEADDDSGEPTRPPATPEAEEAVPSLEVHHPPEAESPKFPPSVPATVPLNAAAEMLHRNGASGEKKSAGKTDEKWVGATPEVSGAVRH